MTTPITPVLTTWPTPAKITATDPVSHATWEPLLQGAANADAILRAAILGRVPGATIPGATNEPVVSIPLAPYPNAVDGGMEWAQGDAPIPGTPFGIRVTSGAVHFHAVLQFGGYLKGLSVLVKGDGSDPGSGNRPTIEVVHGGIQYAATLGSSAASGFISNDAANWSYVYPITYTPATRPSLAGGRVFDIRVYRNTNTVVVCAIQATIAPSAT